jgi:hypothetical protein
MDERTPFPILFKVEQFQGRKGLIGYWKQNICFDSIPLTECRQLFSPETGLAEFYPVAPSNQLPFDQMPPIVRPQFDGLSTCLLIITLTLQRQSNPFDKCRLAATKKRARSNRGERLSRSRLFLCVFAPDSAAYGTGKPWSVCLFWVGPKVTPFSVL